MSDSVKPQKRMGRPPKAPEKGRRQNYTFRMSEADRDKVAAAAEQSGRSMSEEIEFRVSESFSENWPHRYVQGKYDELIDYLGGKERIWPCFVMMYNLNQAIMSANEKHKSNKSWLMDQQKQAEIERFMRDNMSEIIRSITISDGQLVTTNAKLFTLMEGFAWQAKDRDMQKSQAKPNTD